MLDIKSEARLIAEAREQTQGASREERVAALAHDIVKLFLAQESEHCDTCRHLRPFELAPELNTCAVVNIRIHGDSAAIFGCNQHEAR